MDVLGHALPLPLLGLDDAQAHGGGRLDGHRARLVLEGLGRLEIAEQQVQLLGDDVEPLELRLERRQLTATLLVLGAQRIGPERAERATAAVEPRAELHPLLEVPAVLLAELLGQVVHPTRVAAQAVCCLLADAVEPLLGRARGRILAHGLPEVRGPV